MKYLILIFPISIVVLLVGVCYTVIELDFRRKSKVISAFCSKPKKENDDARSEPVNKNNTLLKSLKCVTNQTPITLDIEQVKIKNSMKNISLPTKNSYLNAMLEKVEPFINGRTFINNESPAGGYAPPIFVLAPAVYFLLPHVFLGERKICWFWPEKTFEFVISARKSLRISAKTFFFWTLSDFGRKKPSDFGEDLSFFFWRSPEFGRKSLRIFASIQFRNNEKALPPRF